LRPLTSFFRREGCIFTFEAAALAPEKAHARPAALDRSVTREYARNGARLQPKESASLGRFTPKAD
jgi:hypothetical protein